MGGPRRVSPTISPGPPTCRLSENRRGKENASRFGFLFLKLFHIRTAIRRTSGRTAEGQPYHFIRSAHLSPEREMQRKSECFALCFSLPQAPIIRTAMRRTSGRATAVTPYRSFASSSSSCVLCLAFLCLLPMLAFRNIWYCSGSILRLCCRRPTPFNSSQCLSAAMNLSVSRHCN